MASGVSREKSTGEGGQLGGIPIPQTDSVTIGRANKFYELRDRPLPKACAERVLVHLRFHSHPTLLQKGGGRTESDDVIVGVFVTAVGGGAKGASQ